MYAGYPPSAMTPRTSECCDAKIVLDFWMNRICRQCRTPVGDR